MSRSRKKNPIVGMCGGSEKEDKRKANRKLRRAVKEAISRGDDVLPVIDDVSNVWDMKKDGKQYLRGQDKDKWIRK